MLLREFRKEQRLEWPVGTLCKALRALFVDKRNMKALFNFTDISPISEKGHTRNTDDDDDDSVLWSSGLSNNLSSESSDRILCVNLV